MTGQLHPSHASSRISEEYLDRVVSSDLRKSPPGYAFGSPRSFIGDSSELSPHIEKPLRVFADAQRRLLGGSLFLDGGLLFRCSG